MKYVLYIDYRSGRSSVAYAYRPLKAENLGEAIIEADGLYDPRAMYLVRIMVKSGAVEHPERGVSAQPYTSRYENGPTIGECMTNLSTPSSRLKLDTAHGLIKQKRPFSGCPCRMAATR